MWTSVSNYVTNIPFTISGLSEKVEYEFRVCAENFNGTGPPLHGTEPVVIVTPFSKQYFLMGFVCIFDMNSIIFLFKMKI